MAKRAGASAGEGAVPSMMLELALALPQARPNTFADGHHGVRRPRADTALTGRKAGQPRAQQVGAQDPC